MSYVPPTRLFSGFSTSGSVFSRQWTLYDIDLIRQDLLNHFNTRFGERVMRPTFGCRIWDYLFDQLDDIMVQKITDEVQRICESDSRVEVVDIDVYQLDNGVRVEITLNYIPFAVVNTFTVDFENRQTDF